MEYYFLKRNHRISLYKKDIYGKSGRYKSILSKNTYKEPCLNCGDTIVKEAYLGGSIYYCPTCQRI
ncbi:hypothetical protein G7050_01825 [Dysgonomonas sp. HDW5A]|nr:hypothetical protein G7050_01825 [Dysgonomonas sp. HDW5A]